MGDLVQIINPKKKFQKKNDYHEALKNINLTVQKGEIFGIIGQSGAGKSTLIRCLSTLDKPSSGEIIIGGENIVNLNGYLLRRFRKKIGMIFQHFNLLSSCTVKENIAFPLQIDHKDPDYIEARVSELLKLVNLEHRKNSYPSQLSGGEKQRVGIARALALKPEILFCDEATSALDPKMTKEILLLLKELNQKLNLTIILITHQMEVIKQICHKVAVMDKGQIVEMGEVYDVFSSPKQSITKFFLQNTIHDLPSDMTKKLNKNKFFLRLSFRGNSAKEPIISNLIKNFAIDVNILLGWIDTVQDQTIGSLTVEIQGSEESKKSAIEFLQNNNVGIEILHHEL